MIVNMFISNLQVGGRSVVNSDITQLVEIREEDDRFLRLLEVRHRSGLKAPVLCPSAGTSRLMHRS